MENDNTTVLFIDDNPADLRIMHEIFRDCNFPARLITANSGAEALALLKGQVPPSDWQPNLILLDLNMPGMDGFTVLSEIKKDERLRLIPVVILSSSDAERDVLKAYQFHANCYVTKSTDLKIHIQTMKTLHEFWIHTAELPSGRKQ